MGAHFESEPRNGVRRKSPPAWPSCPRWRRLACPAHHMRHCGRTRLEAGSRRARGALGASAVSRRASAKVWARRPRGLRGATRCRSANCSSVEPASLCSKRGADTTPGRAARAPSLSFKRAQTRTSELQFSSESKSGLLLSSKVDGVVCFRCEPRGVCALYRRRTRVRSCSARRS